MNRIKILHFNEGFRLCYFGLENSSILRCKINKEELKWLIMGYEVRTKSKFKPIEVKNSF
ncbi:hypothetical protein [Clostridium neonatale]|uniref:hypothetical protein n=1 Tax=Clostridium neonatale TaxID=137838 RepID=UPI001D687A9E|nr:hypothetical protein [Clostridium neonatale]CAG9710745.1 hypothetical protein CNEO_1500018 [Clostridium neonatale]